MFLNIKIILSYDLMMCNTEVVAYLFDWIKYGQAHSVGVQDAQDFCIEVSHIQGEVFNVT
jgi:hypothetical protein